MPRVTVALVSDADLTAAARVYADRVHDLLRRGGLDETQSLVAARADLRALLEALRRRPAEVVDLAGWLFARALERLPDGGGVTEDDLGAVTAELPVRWALATLAEDRRRAVLLRDGYDLPPQSVGVALGLPGDLTADLVADGRLGLVAAYDGTGTPDLAEHIGSSRADLVTLSRLADGSLEPQRAVSLRRHAYTCRACHDTLDALERGRRLASGLPVAELVEPARTELLDDVARWARRRLPSSASVARTAATDADVGPTLSPVVAIVAVVLAAMLGIGVAALLAVS